MDVLIERCAGLDIGKKDLKACVRRPAARAGRRASEARTFATTTRGLLALAEWLADEQVTVVGMESTGDYWKPVFYLLEGTFETQLLNARHIRNVPGRKTDVTDAVWIAQLVEHGLVRPSLVPPPPIRRLRDLTRYRASLVGERSREAQRLDKLLEDAGVKLSTVVSDVLGASGRAMLGALIDGQRDPQTLADLGDRRLRATPAALAEALQGNFTAHHATLARLMLTHIDQLSAAIAALDAEVDAEMAPFTAERDRLDTIPGVSKRAAEVLIAELGVDMSRFPTPGHLASWAGMCPGNNESAGTHHSGRTRKGDPWLRGILGEIAMTAARNRSSHLGARYRRLATRRGKKRALVAVGHAVLLAAWSMLTTGTDYTDRGPDHAPRPVSDPARRVAQLLAQLNALGYRATLDPITVS
ncbi:IS110 family transposase [Geodermatophilus sp. YIM 151500]|uniref:IS110 family transposase n=1 Tax=Geodermatophilus sp. YIM 151500 TaxID=2984531 RepID=UPI0021E4D566|nr:IS110 family transposase [Geodermatophilus sp. YIM 151500]MCV2492027.1 IS110 family transposase [Geodermatophilus sp. YIM 151500]